MGAVITGWGSFLPDKIVTNDDLSAYLDTNDEWIRDRTGIGERHVGGTTSSNAIEAARKAMAVAGVGPESIDLLILATTTPDKTVPATASTVQYQLGLKCGAFDVNAACSGFTYGFVTACGMIAMGSKRVLMIGSDTLSTITDWDDRNTAVLFGDGAGAVVIEAVDGPGQLLGWHLDCDGSAESILYAEHGGYLKMEGKEVFRRAVRVMVDSSQRSMEQAGVTADQVKLLVPHQANARIVEAACSRLGIPTERTAMVLEHTGNTSSASIPLALVDAIEHGRVDDGDLVLMVGFGAGMTVASALIRWGR
ncbi:MAG: beta-ketoacyl-ACP synthase III [Acidimicrobiia bacterium]